MDKLQKRLSKLIKRPENSLVFGKGFGILKEISQIYKTVFVFDSSRPELKLKNIVYRVDNNDFTNLTDISVIFIDLDKVSYLESCMYIAAKNKSKIVIEGNDAIGRDLSTPLYKMGYECTGLHGFFHVWELKK